MASLNTTITLELAAEDRERIDKLIAALERREQTTPVTLDKLKELAQPAEALNPKTIQQEPEQTTEPAPAPVVDVPAVTAEEIQAEVVKLISANKKAEVKDIIKKYAPRVSEIPEGKRADVMAELKALGD